MNKTILGGRQFSPRGAIRCFQALLYQMETTKPSEPLKQYSRKGKQRLSAQSSPASENEFGRFTFDESELETEELRMEMYKRWLRHFNILRSEEEKVWRLHSFTETAFDVVKNCKVNHTASMCLNHFADMPMEEFVKRYCSPVGVRH